MFMLPWTAELRNLQQMLMKRSYTYGCSGDMDAFGRYGSISKDGCGGTKCLEDMRKNIYRTC